MLYCDNNRYKNNQERGIKINNVETIGDRIRLRYKELGITQTELADAAGIKQPSIHALLSGKSKESKKITQIAKVLKTTPEWLLTGIGDDDCVALPPNEDFTAINFGKFRLEAGVNGFSIDYQDQDEMKPIFFRVDWLKEMGFKANKLIACKITGDSMQPRLYSGDSVVINTETVIPKDGVVFAVNYEGELVIKRMHRDGGNWYLRSDNTDKSRYPDKLCAGDICIIIGQVVHRQSIEI